MKKLVLTAMILALSMSAAFAAPAPVSMKPGEAGFEEIPIGETQVGPYNVAAVYFQAVDMYPTGKGLSREESDMHLEADIHLKPEAAIQYGFGNGEDIWPAYLTVKYEIAKIDGKVVMD
ncbi:MAG: iron transporter, partial [Synergistaceae bacterium]|nr:iron transporter [Synergistaceae bacterium]